MASVATLPPPASLAKPTLDDTEFTSEQSSAADLGDTVAAALQGIADTWVNICKPPSSSSPDDDNDGTCASRPALQCRALVLSASGLKFMLNSETSTNSVSYDQSNTQQSEECGASKTDWNRFLNSEGSLDYLTRLSFTRRDSGDYSMVGVIVGSEPVGGINGEVPLETLQSTIDEIERSGGRTKGGEITQVEMLRLPGHKDWLLSTWGPTEDGVASNLEASASSCTV